MARGVQLGQKVFDDIYRNEVVEALENDLELDFKIINERSFQKGVCPNCGKRELFISRDKPYVLKCQREIKCQYEEKTRDRYRDLFENLSERFPKTESNPNATADAYLQRNRGFDASRLAGWYTQGRRKLANEQWADTVRFPVCNGYWERIIDASAVTANDGTKAGIKFGMTYKNNGWMPQGMTIDKNDRVYIVEGIFHAIALHLAGFKAIASISSVNLPHDVIEANKGKSVTWIIALDNDPAGHKYIPKYLKQIRDLNEKAWVALVPLLSNGRKRDWDDVYRDGQLDEVFMTEAHYQGRLFIAASPKEKAFLLYTRRELDFFLVEFGDRLYSARIDRSKLNKDKEDDQQIEGRRELFLSNVDINQVANCVPQFEYIEKDAITGEQRYFFQFKFPNARQSCKEALPPSAITEPRGFAKALIERTPFGTFDGGEKVLSMLRREWQQNTRTVRTLPFVGYDDVSGIYCYPEFGFYKGSEILVNEHGFLDVNQDGLKTSIRNHPVIRGADFDPSWFTDFRDAFSLNGMATLAWWTGTFFVEQIRSKQASWPFLELTGVANSGKSTLLRFLWRLAGHKDKEGIKPSGSGASAIGLLRELAGVSNLPVVLLESDKETTDAMGRTVATQYNWDEIKTLFDHKAPLRVTGVKSANNDTDTLTFRAAVAISQNTGVEGSEAILTRILGLHMSLDHHTPQGALLAKKLKAMDTESLAGYLRACLNQESAWLARYFEAFEHYEQRFLDLPGVSHSRIVLCHAQVMAAAKATQKLFPAWSDRDLEKLAKHLEARALDRQQRISAEHPTAAQFWQIYHYLNERVITIDEGNGEGPHEVIQETLNHSAEKGVIAINIEHFHNASRQAAQEIIPAAQLRRVLPQSSTYTFIETRKVYSRLERRGLNCWLFKRGK